MYGILSLHRGVLVSSRHEFILLLLQASEDLFKLFFVVLASALLNIVFSLSRVPEQELILF